MNPGAARQQSAYGSLGKLGVYAIRTPGSRQLVSGDLLGCRNFESGNEVTKQEPLVLFLDYDLSYNQVAKSVAHGS